MLESYSVSLPKKSRQGDSLTSIYLCNLTKNLAAQSAHLNYAVLPIDFMRMLVRYVNYIRQPDKKTPDYGKYLKSLREIHESLNELNKQLDKREQKLRQIELHTKG